MRRVCRSALLTPGWRRVPTLQRVDTDRALALLPQALAVALRLHRAGADAALIATALGIEPEGVPSLLIVAEAKLGHIVSADDNGGVGMMHTT
jgi:hypothetical protein